ncbi:MAG: amino acid ABC transporter permease [Firmicutes bacterium]|nr:amino acid ABC transporter permease [Bacillota bacterium]
MPGGPAGNPGRGLRAPALWVWKNLLSPWYNAVLTAVALAVLGAVVPRVWRWAVDAEWSVIPANLTLLLAGTYPREEIWRLWAAVASLAGLAGLSGGTYRGSARKWMTAAFLCAAAAALVPAAAPSRMWLLTLGGLLAGGFSLGRRVAAAFGPAWRRILGAMWMASAAWVYVLLHGIAGSAVFPPVPTSSWGGLTMTLVLTAVGIIASFPLGVLLALGRRSALPAIRWACTAYIETVRGVPLISILFMAQVLLPIFLPDYRLEHVVRAMIGITLFSAAYMAENVRGGLQGVPKGQVEAAQALGLSNARILWLIVLPQALRAVLPSVVGQFISLLKDTSLVAIVGLLELLGIARSILANPAWLGLQAEVYLFVALIYFIFSFSMSSASRRLERALGLGER